MLFYKGVFKLGVNLYYSRNNLIIINFNNGMFFVDNFINVEKDIVSVYVEW